MDKIFTNGGIGKIFLLTKISGCTILQARRTQAKRIFFFMNVTFIVGNFQGGGISPGNIP